MSRSQLAPGVEVVAVPGRGLAVRTADGEFLSVRTGDADTAALLARLAGDAGSDAGADAEVARLTGAFENAGYLVPRARRAQWPSRRRDVLLLGEPRITEPLARYLRAAGAEPRPATADEVAEVAEVAAGPGEAAEMAAESPEAAAEPADAAAGSGESAAGSGESAAGSGASASGSDEATAAPVAGPAAVVWCLDGPVPDGLWDIADRLPRRGIAWLRCHREGWQAYVEPLAVTAGDVTSAHVRARRLAATPAHRELAAYWSGSRTSGAPADLTPAAAGLLAALLADDLTRWATGQTEVSDRRRLRRVDLRTLTVTGHTVLPVPDVARNAV